MYGKYIGSLVVNRFKMLVNESGPSCTAGASRADTHPVLV